MARKNSRTKPAPRSTDVNPVAQVAGRIGGTLVAMVAIIMIFGEGYKWIAAPVAAAMMLLGIFLGYFASKQ